MQVSVLRIHDILVRIRIRGSVLLTTGSGFGPRSDSGSGSIFVSDLGKMAIFLGYYFLKLYLHHFSKIKSHKEVTKQCESRVFLLFLHDDRRMDPEPDPYLVLMDPGPNLGGPKTY
jgi:hypothetical protein